MSIDVGDVLRTCGMKDEPAEVLERMWARCADVLEGEPEWGFFVPGRIEVLGKHTDYCGGRTMVVAGDRGFVCAARCMEEPLLVVRNIASGEVRRIPLVPDLEPPVGEWINYPMTVVRRLSRNFELSRGVDVAFLSNLPPASGMSSSSAMMVMFSLVLFAAGRVHESAAYRGAVSSPEDLAGYLATVENGMTFRDLEGDVGVGTFGGSEDHTAILCAEAGCVKQYSYAPVVFERSVPLPPGYVFVVAYSGVKAEKTGAAMEKYNRASCLAREAAEIVSAFYGRNFPHLKAALDAVGYEGVREALSRRGSQEHLVRFEHFHLENEKVVPAAGDALAGAEVESFGRIVDESQRAAEKLLGNQVPETVFLASSARRLGAAASSAFGAGFGGSVWAFVEEEGVNDFLGAWESSYRDCFPAAADSARFFSVNAGPPSVDLLSGQRSVDVFVGGDNG